VTEPFFIPLVAETTVGYDRIGLLDAFESQSLSLISPSADSGQRIIGVNVLQLTDNNVIDEAPQISGSNVVWQSGSNSIPFHREIMFFDGTTTTQVTNNAFTDRDHKSRVTTSLGGVTGRLATERSFSGMLILGRFSKSPVTRFAMRIRKSPDQQWFGNTVPLATLRSTSGTAIRRRTAR